MVRQYTHLSADVLHRAETFWERMDAPTDSQEMLRFSFFLGLFPFAGFLFYYTIVGQIWNEWPFINTTLPVLRGLMCAGLQWIFFATFPTISSLIFEVLFPKSRADSPARITVCTYSMVPMHLAALFVGVPFLNRTTTLLGFAVFLYLLFYGYRLYMGHSILRSALMTFLVTALFALIRQMFVFVIGF